MCTNPCLTLILLRYTCVEPALLVAAIRCIRQREEIANHCAKLPHSCPKLAAVMSVGLEKASRAPAAVTDWFGGSTQNKPADSNK